jgi:hypothetical protein
MTPEFAAIESLTFEADMNIFSGLRSFMRALAEDARVTTIIDAPGQAQAIHERVLALLDLPDPHHAHPHDAALAAYLFILHRTAPDVFADAAERVRAVPQAWWANRVAAEIIRQSERQSTP